MNKVKSKHKYTETDLSVALGHAVQAAADLGISETDLIARLLARVHATVLSDEPLQELEEEKTIYHPGAGP